MRNYIAFVKKEITEQVRTYRILILLSVFFIFGVLSPITAKLMPDILSSFMPGGFNMMIPEPTAVDSWTQFFKNTIQMGLILIVIIFSTGLSKEISKGTLINMLTKGLSRGTVILAKFTGMVISYTISLGLAFIVTLWYTLYLFGSEGVYNLGLSIFSAWLFGVFLLSVLLLGQVLIKSSYGGLLLTGIVVVIAIICKIPLSIKAYSPASLTNNIAIITKGVSVQDTCTSVITTTVLIIIIIISTILMFRKAKI